MGREATEKVEKSGETPLFLDKEALYDEKLPLRSNINNLFDEALDEKYRNKYTTILQKLPEEQMAALLSKARSMELKDGILILKDETGNALIPTFDIREGMSEARTEIYRHEYELCHRRSRRLRIYEFRHTSYQDAMFRMMAARSLPEGKKKEAVTAAVPVIDPREAESAERVSRMLDDERASREDQLLSVMNHTGEEYDFYGQIDGETLSAALQPEEVEDYRFVKSGDNIFRYKREKVKVKIDKTEEDFERLWNDLDGAQEIHELCTNNSDTRAGYQKNNNPFKKHWGAGYRKKIFELIENSENGRVYFQDVENMLYENRFDDFVDEMHKDFGISEDALELLQDAEDGNGDELLDSDSLTNSYTRLNTLLGQLNRYSDPAKVPEEYKELFPIREQIRALVQILGDYTVYIAKLTNLIGKLKYNAAKIATKRDRLMMEIDVDYSGNRRNTPRTKVVESLKEVFEKDIESVREYSSELAQIYSDIFDEEHNRVIQFQDLNGETLTMESNWFLAQQSPIDAYRLAYEAIEEQKQDEATGEWSPEFTEKAGRDHLNTLLELGVFSYLNMPGSRSLKEIIDGLSEEGAQAGRDFPLRFGKGDRADVTNLYETLKLKNLSDLQLSDSDLNKKLNAERLMFIRIGSVIWKNNRISEQERNYEKQKEKRLAVVKLSDKQAEELLKDLENRGFPKARHQEIKKKLVGGIGVYLGETPALGAFLNYDFGDGWSMQFSGGDISGEGAFGGVGVSKKFRVTQNIDIVVSLGAGATNRGEGSAGTGAGASFTNKFESVDITLQIGAGASFGAGVIPGVSVGIGFDWGKEQEALEKTITAKEARAHLDLLDKTKDKYAEVKNHPNRYPELYAGLRHIENIKSLNDESKHAMFENWLQMFRTEIRSLSVDETTKTPLERFIPTGAGAGVALVGDVPVPYAFLEFSLWSRKLVYRVATDPEHVGKIAESAAIAAVQRETGAKSIETRTLFTTEGVIFDDATGRFVLSKKSEAKIDWNQFNAQFANFRDDLSANAKIFVEPANIPEITGENDGLLLLKPQEAHGITQLYIDPELQDDVVVVTNGNKLYLSIKKNTQMYVRREDVGYPFEDRTVSETSTIVITNNPHVPTDVIKKDSAGFMEMRPNRQWTYRQRDLGATSAERRPKLEAQARNFKSLAKYQDWWKEEGNKDRIAFENTSGREQAHEELVGVITDQREASDIQIRQAVKDKVEQLIGKKTEKADIDAKNKLIGEFREKSTEQYDLNARTKKDLTFDWERDYPEISRFLKEKVGGDLNANELQFVHQAFLIESFLDLQSKDPKAAKEDYCYTLENFHLPLAKAVFTDYLKHGGASELAAGENPEAKADEMAIWLIDRFRNIDISAKGAAVKAGTIFSTFVGMAGADGKTRIRGLRAFYNFADTAEKYGVLGKDVLDVKNKGMEGKIARFWLRELSPHRTGVQNVEEIPTLDVEYRKFHDAIYENLRQPFVLKLVPHIAVIFSAEEMNQLKAIYESDKGVSPPPSQLLINNDNIGVIKKLLDKCDEVRNAQISGAPKEIELGNNFKLVIHTEVYEGIYKRCGNPSGLLEESFTLVNTVTKQYFVVAGYGESDIGVQPGFDRVDIKLALGIAAPVPAVERVRTAPKPEAPGKPAPPKVTGVPPAETPPGETPPTATVDQPGSSPVPGIADEGGASGGTAGSSGESGGSEA